jgi:hypothetical protein
MSPAEITERSARDGLALSIATDGNIKITGDPSIIDKWLPLIRENKSGIIVLLQSEQRQQRVEDMLTGNPELKYAVLVDDATTDPVLVTVGVRRLAIFNLEIPLAHYDGPALLQIIEEHSMQKREESSTRASTEGRMPSLSLPDEPHRRAA